MLERIPSAPGTPEPRPGVSGSDQLAAFLLRKGLVDQARVNYAQLRRSKLATPKTLLQVLQDLGYLEESALRSALKEDRLGLRIGDLLVELGFLSPKDLEAALGLPEIYGDVVRDHHEGSNEEDASLLLLVRLADQACYRLGIGHRQDPDLLLVATREADLLDARETTLAELEIMLEDKFFPDRVPTV